ncbi:MAG: hypothetical protein K2Q10_14250 [Rhodospirillales bacterium]|nr:hypothetical protein [Rhodospirillales bacterium]
MLAYPASIAPTPESAGFTVRFRDLPEVITFVDTEGEVLAQAADALNEAIAERIAEREDIPLASPPRQDERLSTVPTQTALKALLWRETKGAGWRRADLARALRWNQRQVDRLFDTRHASRLDQIDAALDALGKRLVIEVRGTA